MLARLTSLLTSLIMAVPMCWCCIAGAIPAASGEAETCASCKQFSENGHIPEAPAPEQDCACCDGLLQRDLSPHAAAAPRLVLVDLQAVVWPRTVGVLLPMWRELAHLHLCTVGHRPLSSAAPLYHQHCALLT